VAYSLTYTSFYYDICTGAVDLDTNTFKMLLVTSSYTADKTHDRRNDITNEVSGTGYTAGGNAVTVAVAQDNTNSRVTIDFTVTSWTSSTITARAGVIYKSRGGASSADELVCYLDFGADVSSSAGTFAVLVADPMVLQN